MNYPSAGELVRQNATDGDTPEKIANRIVDNMDPTRYGHYLRKLFAGIVSTSLNEEVRRNSPDVPAESKRKGGLSTKQRLIRDEMWPRFLATPVTTADGVKTMRDLTSADLRALSQTRQVQARALFSTATRFERLADLMDEARVLRLGDLSQESGRTALAA